MNSSRVVEVCLAPYCAFWKPQDFSDRVTVWNWGDLDANLLCPVMLELMDRFIYNATQSAPCIIYFIPGM